MLQIVRDEFGRGSDFARKITYKTHGSTDQLIQDFRTDPKYRVAVTVDQIATGTDIKPVECLLFPRMVQSRSYFELAAEQRRRIAELERTLGKKTYELEISGKLLRDWE